MEYLDRVSLSRFVQWTVMNFLTRFLYHELISERCGISWQGFNIMICQWAVWKLLTGFFFYRELISEQYGNFWQIFLIWIGQWTVWNILTGFLYHELFRVGMEFSAQFLYHEFVSEQYGISWQGLFNTNRKVNSMEFLDSVSLSWISKWIVWNNLTGFLYH